MMVRGIDNRNDIASYKLKSTKNYSSRFRNPPSPTSVEKLRGGLRRIVAASDYSSFENSRESNNHESTINNRQTTVSYDEKYPEQSIRLIHDMSTEHLKEESTATCNRAFATQSVYFLDSGGNIKENNEENELSNIKRDNFNANKDPLSSHNNKGDELVRRYPIAQTHMRERRKKWVNTIRGNQIHTSPVPPPFSNAANDNRNHSTPCCSALSSAAPDDLIPFGLGNSKMVCEFDGDRETAEGILETYNRIKEKGVAPQNNESKKNDKSEEYFFYAYPPFSSGIYARGPNFENGILAFSQDERDWLLQNPLNLTALQLNQNVAAILDGVEIKNVEDMESEEKKESNEDENSSSKISEVPKINNVNRYITMDKSDYLGTYDVHFFNAERGTAYEELWEKVYRKGRKNENKSNQEEKNNVKNYQDDHKENADKNQESTFSDRAKLENIHDSKPLTKPDILILNEMDIGMARSKNAHTTAELAQLMGYSYAYGIEFLELTNGNFQEIQGVSRSYKSSHHKNLAGYHGNAVLVDPKKFEIERAQVKRLHPKHDLLYRRKNFGMDKGEQRLGGRMALFTWLRIKEKNIENKKSQNPKKSKKLLAISAHAHCGASLDLLQADARMLCMEIKKSFLSDNEKERADYVVIGGDLCGPFNAPGLSGLHEKLSKVCRPYFLPLAYTNGGEYEGIKMNHFKFPANTWPMTCPMSNTEMEAKNARNEGYSDVDYFRTTINKMMSKSGAE